MAKKHIRKEKAEHGALYGMLAVTLSMTAFLIILGLICSLVYFVVS